MDKEKKIKLEKAIVDWMVVIYKNVMSQSEAQKYAEITLKTIKEEAQRT